MEGGKRRYSRVIKGSPGRADVKINKPTVMNKTGSLESSQIYSVLIVIEIRVFPSGQICKINVSPAEEEGHCSRCT